MTIEPSNLPFGYVGVGYEQALTAILDFSPTIWKITSGALPDGISIDESSGTIAGNPTQIGWYTFTITVSSNSIYNQSYHQFFSLNIYININTKSLNIGVVGSAYNQILTATGGTLPYTWSIISGSLPTGITLENTGTLSGVPQSISTSDLQIEVTDSDNQSSTAYFILVIVEPLSIITNILPSGISGIIYKQQLTATGGNPPYSWSVTAGSLPANITLTPNTGILSGTTQDPGAYNIEIELTDSYNLSINKSFTLIFLEQLAFTTVNLSPGILGIDYEQPISITGGNPPYTWSIINGLLPNGITINSITGVLSGTPQLAAAFVFQINVVDTNEQSITKSFTLVISDTLSIMNNPTIYINYASFSVHPFLATGGTLPYSWNLTISEPHIYGKTNPTTGILGIIAIGASTGTYNQQIEINDALGQLNTMSFTLVVTNLTITTNTLLFGTINQPYNQSLTVEGGTPPYTWSVISSSLPSGINLDPDTGILSGNFQITGTSNFQIEVTDKNSLSNTQPFTLIVTNIPEVTIVNSLPINIITSSEVSYFLSAAGGTPPYTWSIINGSLPNGIALNSYRNSGIDLGVLSGNTQIGGIYNVQIEVSDSSGISSISSLTINVISGAISRNTKI